MIDEEVTLAQAEYERFKLMWMLDHGFSLTDFVRELENLRKESELNVSIEDVFANWEFGCGFGSQIWPCFNEFLECEYKEMQAARDSVPTSQQKKEKQGFIQGTKYEKSVVAQLKERPRPGQKKTVPQKGAEMEI